MTTRDHILAIDNGTQSLKAMIFDLQGKMRGKVQVPFEPYVSPQPGWAEQDPALFWRTLCEACQRLWQKGTLFKEAIAGVALTTQRATVINMGADGRPLRPAIVWLDQRKAKGLAPMKGPWAWIFRLTGLSGTINYLRSEAEAHWLALHDGDVWRRTHKYLLLSGYLTFQLTGEYVDSVGCQVGYIPFNYKLLRWARWWDWHWPALPIQETMLPRLVAPAQVLGQISAQAARETGIPAGLPLIAAAADKACEVIGSGALENHIGCLSYGTTATINVTHRRYVEPIRLLPAYPSAVPQHYNVEVEVFRGYWMVEWFKQQFGHLEQEAARQQGVTAEALFEKLLEQVPPGAMGLMLQPYWSPGLKFPGPEAKGAVIGFGDVHTRAHLYRAILEGLAYALREGRERLERRTGTRITTLRVSGGGSQSDQALQLTADIFGLPTVRPHLYETAGLGAAIDAAVGLGLHSDFTSAVQAMTHTGRLFEPDPVQQRQYERLYHEVYKQMYKRLRPLYERIRKITGYPPDPAALK
ncbi:MAG: FGGY-family carbohydrate kinase [Desulfobacteraceae bacterium]|nr:FGGY-family carbohydrate kinase [Desulfobacteraceae bacterium]